MNWRIEKTIDLRRPPVSMPEKPYLLMLPGDESAHQWIITVLMHGQPVDLSGYTATAIFERHDHTVVTCSGANASVDGNVVTITFRAECYNVPGGMRGAVRLTGSAGTVTLADQAFIVQRDFSGDVVQDEFIPSLTELLANVSRLEQANNLAMVLLATNGISTVSVSGHTLSINQTPVAADDAYEAAVAAGYTGTEEQWEAFVAALTANESMITEANENASEALEAVQEKAEVTSETVTALASGWSSGSSPHTQTISCSIATADNNLIVGVGGALTGEQKTAIDMANIVCTGQDDGEITLTAYGVKPSVDIPINVLGVN